MRMFQAQSVSRAALQLAIDSYQPAGGRSANRVLKRFSNATGVTLTNSGTAATTSIDAASPFGRPAYKVEMAAGNVYAEIGLSGLGLAAFDGHLVWRVWVEDYTKIAQVVAYAGTAGYSRLHQVTHNLNNSNTNRLNGEQMVVVGALASAGTNTFVKGVDTLSDAKIRIFPQAAGGTVWIDALLLPGVGRPTHCLTFDDCSVTWIDQALPYLKSAGLKASFGINSGGLNSNPALYLTTDQHIQIAAERHSLGSHNVTNTAYNDGTGGTQSAAEYGADFTASLREQASSIVGRQLDPRYHPLVQGKVNSALVDELRARGVRIARGVDTGYNFPQVGLGQHVFQMKCLSLHTMSQPEITAACDAVIKYGLTAIWMVHEITTGTPTGVQTSATNFQFAMARIGGDVQAERAVQRQMGQLAEELYNEGLVASALL